MANLNENEQKALNLLEILKSAPNGWDWIAPKSIGNGPSKQSYDALVRKGLAKRRYHKDRQTEYHAIT